MLALTTRPASRHDVRGRATSLAPCRHGRGIHDQGAPFAPLIDAKAAGRLLGVPHTWLLAQARAGRIPHHRLGHYVRSAQMTSSSGCRKRAKGRSVQAEQG
jgi:hypothetical protein